MKAKLLITTLALLGSASVSFAEGEECDKKKCKGPKGAMSKRISDEKKAEILAEFDKDGDGELNEEERTAAREAFKAKMLEKHDTDGDGELSDEEKKAARKAFMMQRFDKDGDGELSDEEKKAIREAFQRRGGFKGGRGPRGPQGGGKGL